MEYIVEIFLGLYFYFMLLEMINGFLGQILHITTSIITVLVTLHYETEYFVKQKLYPNVDFF